MAKRPTTTKPAKAEPGDYGSTSESDADLADPSGADEDEDEDAGDDASDQASAGVDTEAQHTAALDRMTAIADELEISTDEMIYDVRDFLLDTIKARPKPWSGTSQAEQRDVAAACEHAAREVVRKIVEAVASNGVQSIRVLLTKVNMGTDIIIQGKVKTFGENEEDKAVLQLHRAINKYVMLTRATAEDYAEGEREAETDPDNHEFGFESGDDDDGDGDFED